MNSTQELLQQLSKETNWRSRRRSAVQWLRQKYLFLVQQVKGRLDIATPLKLIREGNLVNNIEHGRMYFYGYNPKTRAKLPFYDNFPLIIPIETYSPNKFLGINFHYLPYNTRTILMSEMLKFVKGEESLEYINLSYSNILRNFSKLKSSIPCLHRYDLRYVSTPISLIKPDDWVTALYLPTERFSKRSKSYVWNDSTNKIKGLNG